MPQTATDSRTRHSTNNARYASRPIPASALLQSVAGYMYVVVSRPEAYLVDLFRRHHFSQLGPISASFPSRL